MTAAALAPQDVQRIAQSAGWRARRVEVLDAGAAGPVIVKGQRPTRRPARYRALNVLAWLLGVPFLKAVPMHGGARAQQIEIARLRALHAAGAAVPEVLHVAPDHFVMRWLGGANLSELLHAGHPQILKDDGREVALLAVAALRFGNGIDQLIVFIHT